MDFVSWNWKKYLLHFAVNFLLFGSLTGLLFLHTRHEPENASDPGFAVTALLKVPLFFSLGWTSFFFLIHLWIFNIARRVFNDTSETALTKVFSEGDDYSIEKDDSNFYQYTKECIKGKISGFSLSLKYEINTAPPSKYGGSGRNNSIDVSVFCINQWHKPSIATKSIYIKTSLQGEITEDISSDIIEFIEQLKNKGNTPNLCTEPYNETYTVASYQ